MGWAGVKPAEEKAFTMEAFLGPVVKGPSARGGEIDASSLDQGAT